MYAHFYAGMQWTALPIFALLLFLSTFLAATVWAWRSSRRSHFDAAARLPFDDNERVSVAEGKRR